MTKRKVIFVCSHIWANLFCRRCHRPVCCRRQMEAEIDWLDTLPDAPRSSKRVDRERKHAVQKLRDRRSTHCIVTVRFAIAHNRIMLG